MPNWQWARSYQEARVVVSEAEWSRRHSPGSAGDARFMASAEAVLHDCEAQGA
jgi:hypothetical protein